VITCIDTKDILEDDTIRIDWKTKTIVVKEIGWVISFFTDRKK
jgi:hypothetical protein